MQGKIAAEYNAVGAQRSRNVADVRTLPADSNWKIRGRQGVGDGGRHLEWKNTSWPRSRELEKTKAVASSLLQKKIKLRNCSCEIEKRVVNVKKSGNASLFQAPQ